MRALLHRKFPGNREFNWERSSGPPFGNFRARENPRKSGLIKKIPCAREQGILEKEQGFSGPIRGSGTFLHPQKEDRKRAHLASQHRQSALRVRRVGGGEVMFPERNLPTRSHAVARMSSSLAATETLNSVYTRTVLTR